MARKAVNRSGLVGRIVAGQSSLAKKDVESSLHIVLSAITESLAKGQRVEIRGFGSFCLHNRKARVGRNPKTGEKVMLPVRSVPYFKPGKELRERVKSSQKSQTALLSPDGGDSPAIYRS